MKNGYQICRLSRPDWAKVLPVELAHTGWLEAVPISATAQACHDGENLWVRLEAEEAPLRATLTGTLDQVCDDSCLEFFFAPVAGDGRYFNFEWNPLGTLYLGWGGERSTRVRQIVKRPQALFSPQPFSTQKGWGIAFRIPLDFLRLYIPDYRFSGQSAGNFYKCGDRTERPHYLAWSPLTSPTPDYHRRQDFGGLYFL